MEWDKINWKVEFTVECPRCGLKKLYTKLPSPVICPKCGVNIMEEILKKARSIVQIEAPCNSFPSQITGPSGEQVYWAPVGSLYPVCPDGIDQEKVKKYFDKATLKWAYLIVGAIGHDVFKTGLKSEKAMKKLKRNNFGEGIPFISISSMPLNEDYFDDYYLWCYFASKPYKMAENSYITVGMIGP